LRVGCRLRGRPGCAQEPEGKDNAMGKVMVVDDAYSELTMMEGILRTAGHKVVSLIDGERLEDKVAEEQPDVLLLDIVLPKRNGYEILRSIKRDGRTKDTPVVVVSSKNQESDRVWGKRQGADEYLGKPFTAEQLLEAVRRFVP
jgi:twitching motility two-component system response regulator PilH